VVVAVGDELVVGIDSIEEVVVGPDRVVAACMKVAFETNEHFEDYFGEFG
jgi:hypothetical protein